MKAPSKIGRDRAHLLSGILKCPKCGEPMYTNKHSWTNKDGTYKEIYYYVCSKARTARGKSCAYKAMLKKTEIEPLVIEAIRELIQNQDFATEIKSKIGKQIDTSKLDRELKNYESKLREVDLNKTRLENKIDSLPEDTRFRERKLHDMTLRLDGLYDIIVELEEKIEDVKLRPKAVEQDAITLENIYTLLANFEKVYNKISDEEKKSLTSSLIKEIEIFPCDDSELSLKSILFNFPVYKDGGDVCEFSWYKSTHVSTVLPKTHKVPDSYINVTVNFGNSVGMLPLNSIVEKAEAYKPKQKITYKLIKDFILEKYSFKVHTAYIAEVKRGYGLPMYDAPNAVETLKHPRKHPTPIQVDAIKDALAYFEVI